MNEVFVKTSSSSLNLLFLKNGDAMLLGVFFHNFYEEFLLFTIFVFTDMRDDFRILPKDTDVSVGQDTILKCSPPKGHPSPEVRWKKDGDFLDLTSSNRYKI